MMHCTSPPDMAVKVYYIIIHVVPIMRFSVDSCRYTGAPFDALTSM